MNKGAQNTEVVRFATFELDVQAGELRKGGLKLKLSGQPVQVLAILLERPGAVVTRDELQKRLWPDTFVDVDHNLNTAINKRLILPAIFPSFVTGSITAFGGGWNTLIIAEYLRPARRSRSRCRRGSES